MLNIVPDEFYVSVLDIDPSHLVDEGYKAVLLDLDNTLLPRGREHMDSAGMRWVADLEKAGLKVALLSNSSGTRALDAGDILGVPVVRNAFKPFSRGFIRACAMLGVAPCDAVMIGDQSYTDVLGAHRVGMDAFMVMPQNENEPLHTFMMRAFDRKAVKGLRAKGSRS